MPKEDQNAKIVKGSSPVVNKSTNSSYIHTYLLVRTSRYLFSNFSREQACETRLGSREKTHSPVSHSLAAISNSIHHNIMSSTILGEATIPYLVKICELFEELVLSTIASWVTPDSASSWKSAGSLLESFQILLAWYLWY